MALDSVESFETRCTKLAADIIAIKAQIGNLSVDTWAGSTGADYEAVYNDLTNGTDIPTGGAFSKDQMNSYISAINAVEAAIQNASTPIALVREADPDILT